MAPFPNLSWHSFCREKPQCEPHCMLFPRCSSKQCCFKAYYFPICLWNNSMSDVAPGASTHQCYVPLGLWLKMWNDVMKRPCRTSPHEMAIRNVIGDINAQYFSLPGATNVLNGFFLYLTAVKWEGRCSKQESRIIISILSFQLQ